MQVRKNSPGLSRDMDKKLAVQFDKAPKLYWLGIGKDDFLYRNNAALSCADLIKKDINMSLWKLLVDMYGPALSKLLPY